MSVTEDSNTHEGGWRIWVVAAVLAGTLLLASLPYLYGYVSRPAGALFYAVPPMNYGDASQYLALARQVRDGRLLVSDPFTTEPHDPKLFIPLTIFEGLLARLPGPSLLGAFQVSRVLCGAALLAAGWWFGTLFLPDWRRRWLFLGLLCFSAGAGWLLETAGVRIPNGDALQPEANTFYTLGNLPNVAFASALLTAVFGTAVAYERDGRKRWPALTLLCSALLAWTHPFDFATLGMGLGAYAVVRWINDRKLPGRLIIHGIAAVLAAVPAAAYLLWLTGTDPVYAALAGDNSRKQGFLFYAIAQGLLALPAGAVLFVPELRRQFALPLCWVVCVFLFLLTPFSLGGKQGRLLGGVHVPLALLAAAGIDHLTRRLAREELKPERRRLAIGLSAGYLLLTATGGWGILRRHFEAYAARNPDPYVEVEARRLLQVMEEQGETSHVALGGEYTGGWTPVLAGIRVFHGHWHMTLDERRKAAERDWFFTGAALPEHRAAWLRLRGIDWVIWYPREWTVNGRIYSVPLEDIPGLEPVFTSPTARLYRFPQARPSFVRLRRPGR